ncbi:MAG: alanine racemase [Candidatus Magasanikbacteria bacterium]|nr:alanine racemase [Candidatus Magasanikbacteria bacterium]
MRFLRTWRQWHREHFSPEPLVKVLIYRDNLLNNLEIFRSLKPGIEIAPVLKSNAYGHGLLEVAEILNHTNVPFICVDSVFEAKALRRDNFKLKILVLNYVKPRVIAENKLKNIMFAVVDLAQLKELSILCTRPVDVHIKVDTGMNRQGIQLAELPEATRLLKKNRNLNVIGIFSHLADPLNRPRETSDIQIPRWQEARTRLTAEFSTIKYIHIRATSGFCLKGDLGDNVARVGVGFYGLAHFVPGLKPALELQAEIMSVRSLKKTEHVGYNFTFEAQSDAIIATLPVGYFEGVDLRLSNRGIVKVGSAFCPIIGRVSMNITSIDVSGVKEAKPGQIATVISRDLNDLNSVANLAKQCDTISYEILVHIPGHLRREIIF